MALKAVRGAGFPWGLAEEAAMTARCLSSFNLPGPESLLLYIEGEHGVAPDISSAVWSSQQGNLCPLWTGTTFSDFASELSFPLKMLRVHHPILLLGFIHQASVFLQCGFDIQWHDMKISIFPSMINSSTFSTLPSFANEVTITSRSIDCDISNPTLQFGRDLPISIWRRYESLSFETMVPESDTSRSGAGAGDTDND